MTETFAEAAERLKNNENHILFADMKEKEVLKKVGPVNCEFLTSTNESDLLWESLGCGSTFLGIGIYRIRPDYQPRPPKPEYVPCEVYEEGNRLYFNRPDGEQYPIISAPCFEDFRGFFYSNERQEPGVPLDQVARRMAEGKKVVARFERR